MTLEDLQYIFKTQLEQIKGDDSKLFFMLQDANYNLVERVPANDIQTLIPMLSSFQYVGQAGNIPRFAK